MKDLRPVSLPDMERLGRWDDGGYVVPISSITKADRLFSFGVNDDVSFEAAVVERKPAIRVYCFDPSVSVKILMARALKLGIKGLMLGASGKMTPALRELKYPKRVVEFAQFFRMPNVHFIKKKLWYTSDESSVCVADIFANDGEGLAYVKMDIEGSEYRVIKHLYPYLDRITGIAVEFHDVDVHMDQIDAIVSELKKKFYVAHVHGNNITGYVHETNIPMTLEMTFTSKALYDDAPPPSDDTYPRAGLDWPNHYSKPDIPIAFCDA